ncbi:dioxygenase [Permianibacter sp. IMCC34836]|uniref:DODA-type extradiol aromatic ring-opening family dioxygenase n=1 Tax=Permianibacter fluminis TaxID=2738515 RepID=UPI0015540CB5|nr:class III extradiol ring-cleavage dioxygenase [Permianibacter fluminis]NQD35860.1 dioxygenase [Permianibacter fluminis]
MTRQPVLFVSHGAPTLPLQPGATGALWQQLGAELAAQAAPPRAILVLSAHWASAQPQVSAASQPATIHDFYGFPEPLYALQYPAPGAPALATRIQQLLSEQGIETHVHPDRGLDHGAWVPLLFLRPAADIPVLQLSIQPQRDPRWHFALGLALTALRDDGVLILASGSASHNLREVMSGRYGADSNSSGPDWLQQFRHWLITAVAARDTAALLDYKQQAPHALRNHPTDEHLLPLFAAIGAAGDDAVEHFAPEITLGALAMDVWRWQQGAS